MDNVKTAYTDNITWAIKENGELWGLGSNECGKLGDGTEENRNEPQKIMDNVRYVKDGGWYTLAITENDELWGWGITNTVNWETGRLKRVYIRRK